MDKIINKYKKKYKKNNNKKNNNKYIKKTNNTIKLEQKAHLDNIKHTDNTDNTDNTNITNIHHKETIPKRIRELVWTKNNGEVFSNNCYVSWCENKINVFNFQVGHNIPESKGGTLEIDNLKPICSNCNLSMGNRYTIDEWCKLIK